MTIPLRVHMQDKRGASFLSPDDIAASISASPNTKMGRRFSIDVAEEAFAKGAGAMIEGIAHRLAERAVYENRAEIERVIGSYIHDREWAEPILREAIREAMQGYVRDVIAQGAALERRL